MTFCWWPHTLDHERMLKGQGQSREGCLKYRTEYILGGMGVGGEEGREGKGGEWWGAVGKGMEQG